MYFCQNSDIMWRLIIIPLIAFSIQAAAQGDTLNRTDNQGKKTGYWISRDPSGKKIYEGTFHNGRPVGRFLRFHANGKIRVEMNYMPDGIAVKARLFDPEGRLRAEGIYRNQVKDSLWSFYSEKNIPVYRIKYANGLVNGEALRFDANGALIEQTQWIKNKLVGLQIIYYPDNKPQAKINYQEGKIDGTYQLLYPDGKTEVDGSYYSDLKTGKWVYYKPNGQPDYILNYNKGTLLNPEILDARQRESFDRYEKNRKLLRDPKDFINNPEELMIR